MLSPCKEGHIAIVCPDCGGFEMASTRDCMDRKDWNWVGKMLEHGWDQKNATPEQIRAMPFGCQCDPKRYTVPIKH